MAVCAVIEPFEKGPFSVCIFHGLTGLPCPACGLTRSFVWLLHGELSRSLQLNPFGVVIFSAWTWKSVTDLWFLRTGRDFRLLRVDQARLVRRGFVTVFLLFGLVRMVTHVNEFVFLSEFRNWIASRN